MAAISAQIEGIPGYNELADFWNDYAGNKFSTKDPYYVELPNGKTKRRQPPEMLNTHDRKVWKRIISKAWFHDQCFLNIPGLNIGLGMCPIVCLVPVIGPTFMWAMHGRIMRIADELHVPASVQAKISGNIFFDFLCSLIPVLGSLFAWINACSTRNAALIDTYLRRREQELDMRAGPYDRVEQVPSTTNKAQQSHKSGFKKVGQVGQQVKGTI